MEAEIIKDPVTGEIFDDEAAYQAFITAQVNDLGAPERIKRLQKSIDKARASVLKESKSLADVNRLILGAYRDILRMRTELATLKGRAPAPLKVLSAELRNAQLDCSKAKGPWWLKGRLVVVFDKSPEDAFKSNYQWAPNWLLTGLEQQVACLYSRQQTGAVELEASAQVDLANAPGLREFAERLITLKRQRFSWDDLNSARLRTTLSRDERHTELEAAVKRARDAYLAAQADLRQAQDLLNQHAVSLDSTIRQAHPFEHAEEWAALESAGYVDALITVR